LFILLFSLKLLASCGNDTDTGFIRGTDGIYRNDSPVAVAIILGRHANAMAIPESAYRIIESYIDQAVYGGHVSLIIADGVPWEVDMTGVGANFFVEDARNETALRRTIGIRTGTINTHVRDLQNTARVMESDLLGAIRLARNELSASHLAHINYKHIVVVHTGLSTQGDLNLLDIDLQGRRADEIVEWYLQGILPNLYGINVTFIGFDDGMAVSAYPQVMTTSDRQLISNLWHTISISSGAVSVRFENASGWNIPNLWTGEHDSPFQFVSTITFSNERIFDIPLSPATNDNDTDIAGFLPPFEVDLRIGEESVPFEPGTAQFLNEERALEFLTPIVEVLDVLFASHPNERLWLVGTTVSLDAPRDTRGFNLSIMRAEAVREAILNFGYDISEENILTVGLGAWAPWHTNEWINGRRDETLSLANRAVWLLSEHDTKFIDMLYYFDNDALLPESQLQLYELLNN